MTTKPTKHILVWNTSCLEKETGPVRFEPRTFAVSGVFVTSRPSLPETQRNLNSILTEPKFTISSFDHSVNKVNYGKKSRNRLQYRCYRKGKNNF